MKKNKTVLLLVLITISVISCLANGQKNNTENMSDLLELSVHDDSLMFKMLNDSVTNVIKNAKDVSATLIVRNDSTGTYDLETTQKLSVPQSAVLKFLVSAPQNYEKNTVVYGLFVPNVTFKFKHKKTEFNLLFDFGLEKWKITDSKGNEISRFDIGSPELLRFAKTVFPNDIFLNHLNK